MAQSNAYKQFRERTQEIFNFAVLVTSSVPVLKLNLKLLQEGTINRLPDPDYFKPSVIYEINQETLNTLISKGIKEEKIEKLKILKDIPLNNAEFKLKVIEAIGEENYKAHRNTIKRQSKNYIDNMNNCLANYQPKLATYLYFSTFSYFEAFVIDISLEIISGFNKLDKAKYIEDFKPSSILISDMKKLTTSFDPRKMDRYNKLSSRIRSKGYYAPESLLFSSLSDIYTNKIENIKANEIPVFLEKTLMFRMTEEEVSKFHSIRDNRNSIGHGSTSFSPHLNDVIAANKFFKSLSERIDKHISFYFFKLNNYTQE